MPFFQRAKICTLFLVFLFSKSVCCPCITSSGSPTILSFTPPDPRIPSFEHTKSSYVLHFTWTIRFLEATFNYSRALRRVCRIEESNVGCTAETSWALELMTNMLPPRPDLGKQEMGKSSIKQISKFNTPSGFHFANPSPNRWVHVRGWWRNSSR